MLDSNFQGAMQGSYSTYTARLVRRLRDDKHNGLDSRIRRNAEALKAHLFEQSVQIRVGIWRGKKRPVVLLHWSNQQKWILICATISRYLKWNCGGNSDTDNVKKIFFWIPLEINSIMRIINMYHLSCLGCFFPPFYRWFFIFVVF